MKDVINNRIKRLEEILKKAHTVCMIARQDQEGYHWNGVIYANEKELSAAVRLTVGDYPEVPLIILSKVHTDMTGGAL